MSYPSLPDASWMPSLIQKDADFVRLAVDTSRYTRLNERSL
jgi:hypothetical protein